MADLLPAPAQDSSLDFPSRPQRPQRLPPRWLRWLFRRWWGVAGTLGALIVGDLLGIPLATSPAHYWDGVKNQFGELITLVTTYPIFAVVAVVAVILLTVFGYIENRRVQEEERRRRLAEIGEATEQALRPDLDQLAQGQQDLAQDFAAGQDVAITFGAANLAATTTGMAVIQVELSEIMAAVARSEQQTPAVAPELAGATALPLPTSFVGRDGEKQQIRAALTSGESVGLCALAGMGGVGKSALAAVMVNELSQDEQAFPGKSAWISCDGLVGAEGLAELWSRAARELGLSDIASEADPELRRAKLAHALSQRPLTLLALDNVETLTVETGAPGLDAEAALATLAVPGHTAVLLTSREQVASSRVQLLLELPPLPDPEAERLLGDRLQQRNPSRPTPADAAQIPALVEAVGGLPLAVELLAAYAGATKLDLATIAGELTADGINAAAFKEGPKKVLTARFDRSYALLSPRQQRVFAGLSLLARNSFPRELALALVQAAASDAEDNSGDGANAVAEAHVDASGDVATLLYCSLVESLEGGRLRLHPLLREYGAARLLAMGMDGQQSDPPMPGSAAETVADHLGDAMVAWWLAFAQAQSDDLAGILAFEAEADGLMSALRWAHEHGRHEAVLALVGALSGAWDRRGRRADELRMYQWAYEAAVARDNPGEQSSALHNLSVTYGRTGQIAQARAGYERALALAEQLGDLSNQSLELQSLAVLDIDAGKGARARDELNRTLALAQQVQAPDRIVEAVWWLAELDRLEGNREAACAGFGRALAIYAQLGNPNTAPTRQRLRDLGCEP